MDELLLVLGLVSLFGGLIATVAGFCEDMNEYKILGIFFAIAGIVSISFGCIMSTSENVRECKELSDFYGIETGIVEYSCMTTINGKPVIISK